MASVLAGTIFLSSDRRDRTMTRYQERSFFFFVAFFNSSQLGSSSSLNCFAHCLCSDTACNIKRFPLRDVPIQNSSSLRRRRCRLTRPSCDKAVVGERWQLQHFLFFFRLISVTEWIRPPLRFSKPSCTKKSRFQSSHLVGEESQDVVWTESKCKRCLCSQQGSSVRRIPLF